MEPRITAAAPAVDSTADNGAAKKVDQVLTGNIVSRVRDNRDSNEKLLNSGGLVVEEQVICWERFLPRRFLRVLLVENDDSTRHIVAALLRKCNYQVAAVADGLKAWAVLKKRHYNFDLVLTEVVMPSLSGIGLLSKIMSNEICKTIPVIMMSSHDSIGIVFKCMLKGAADFLVKPVRKNELRNLWQHVWRKYCSGSYGDGSENGKPNETKLETVSDNEVASNHRSANAGSRSKTGDSSDKGSRTRSLCRKSETEIESAQKLEEPLETENRIFSEETDPELGMHDCNMAMVATSSIHEKGKAKDHSMEKKTKVTLSIHEVVSTKEGCGKTGTYGGSLQREEDPASVRNNNCENIDPEHLDQNDRTNNLPKEIIEFIGAATSAQCSHVVLEDNEQREDILYSSAKSSDKKRTICSFGSSTLWELSLRRPQLSKEEEVFQAKHVLKHSIASAFSRYRNARSHFSCPRSGSASASFCSKTKECCDLNHGICSSAENGRGIPFPLIVRSTSSHGGESLVNCQLSSGCDKEDVDPSASLPSREPACIGISSNKDISPHPQRGVVPFSIPVGAIHMNSQLSSGCDKEDVDPSSSVPSRETACIGISSDKNVSPHPQLGVVPFSIPVGAIPFQSTFTGFGTVMQPIFYPDPSVLHFGSSEGQKEIFVIPSNPSAHDCSHLINNALHWSSHHYVGNHHSNQLMQDMEAQRVDFETAYPRVVLHPSEEKVNLGGNCNFATTIAGGSNGTYEEISMAANKETALESRHEDGFLNCNGKGLDSDRSRREAALTKFRLKRKDRCFEKKVRYYNRKKLAEKRPRLKGQFVRQAVADSTTIAARTDD
ncbi:Signal transduction response regulator [Macleaya cordata]|uniref:Signal transduction response regulator n=1 Tax=Macleaya cordata TaxID=56857 RepID=A0A200Q9K0_MACCD|nr:Signal transduction response regulator [Macleaya cordata]